MRDAAKMSFHKNKLTIQMISEKGIAILEVEFSDNIEFNLNDVL